MGRGGGLVVGMLAFPSDNPSSNPAEVYSFFGKCCLKRTKINKTRPRLSHLFKKTVFLLRTKILRKKIFYLLTNVDDVNDWDEDAAAAVFYFVSMLNLYSNYQPKTPVSGLSIVIVMQK